MSTTSLPRCERPACTGHLGKFAGCVTEALYTLSLDGTWPTTGSVEAYGHFVLMVIDETTSVDIGSEGSPDVVDVLPGFYVIVEDDHGHVSLEWFDTADLAREYFELCEQQYAAWDSGVDI